MLKFRYNKAFILLVFILGINNVYSETNLKELDLTKMTERGQMMYVETEGRPVWRGLRTVNAIKDLESRSDIIYSNDPDDLNKVYRSYTKDYFVVLGGCPKGDELPYYYPDDGFLCKSNCAQFDMAGRPKNSCTGKEPMAIPIHYFKNSTTIVVPTNQDGNT